MSRPTTPRSPESTAGESEKQETSKPAETSQDNTNNKSNETDQSLSNPRTVALLISVFLSMFLVAMDRTIISTAIPRITDDFNSLPDVGWYGSIYLLTCCAFQLLFGKLYAFYPVKVVLLTSILLFEISSAICGAAPNSTAFIVGRAISGVGAAGIFAGTIVSIVHAVPLNKRPKLQGMMGAVMGVTTVIGPLIGGAFTSNVTWRWCFYINLPFGALAMFVICFFYQFPDQGARAELPWKKKLAQLDAPGTALLVPGVVCILLALQWGGQTYAWSNARIIVLLTVGGVLFIGFMSSQVLFHQTATIPPRILKYRSVAAGLWSTLCIGASQYIFIYYLPIWFQSIKGVEPVDSGIRLLPLMLGMITASIGGGFLNQKIGYYTPFGIVGTCLMSIGAGLITTFQAFGTGSNKWIGYQVLYGFGMGLCFQTPNLATQTVLPKKDAPMGLALMFFGQLLGAAIFVSVGENVLDNELLKRLAKIGIPGFDKSLVTSGGATTLLEAVPPELRSAVLIAYNEALRKVFQIGLIISCLTILGTGSMEWKNILKKRAEEDQNSKMSESEEKKGEEKNGEEKKVEQTV